MLSPLQHFPDHICSTAGGHDFLAGREKGRAHGRRILATPTAAVALLKIADEGAVFEREGESWRERQLNGPFEIFAQMRVNSKTSISENFSWIHPPTRIEHVFDLAHQFEQFVAELGAHIFGARNPNAMLGRERSLELLN